MVYGDLSCENFLTWINLAVLHFSAAEPNIYIPKEFPYYCRVVVSNKPVRI